MTILGLLAVWLVVSGCIQTCIGWRRLCGLSVAAICWESVVWPSFFNLMVVSIFSCFFCLSPSNPFFFLHCFTVWRVPGCPCLGAHGWVAGNSSHGSIFFSRVWLFTVEALGHLGHLPSTQSDSVVISWRAGNLLLFLYYYSTLRWSQV